MKLAEAQQLATKYQIMFKPFCERVEIAGSVRREMPEVKDIELVAIPIYKPKLDLFGKNIGWISLFDECLYFGKDALIKNGPKYKQLQLPEGIKLDLFLANKENFGNILLIRTGSAQFSKWIMGTKTRQVGLIQKDGYLWRNDERLSCPEEKDVFRLLKIDYIEPKDRNL